MKSSISINYSLEVNKQEIDMLLTAIHSLNRSIQEDPRSYSIPYQERGEQLEKDLLEASHLLEDELDL